MIKPKWINYNEWEEYKNGMYENGNRKEIILKCIDIFLAEDLKENMAKTAIEYKKSAEVNLTNKMFNPVSWLGQATCNFLINAKAQEVCQAWIALTKEQQDRANNIAKEVIKEWRDNYESLQKSKCF